jgi:hypothetical protein
METASKPHSTLAADSSRVSFTALFSVLELFPELIQAQSQAGGVVGCYFGNFSLEMGGENLAVRKRLQRRNRLPLLHRPERGKVG